MLRTCAARFAIFGNTARGVRAANDSLCTASDIVGMSTGGTDIPHRLLAGEILGMMDIVAGRTAMCHATGQRVRTAESKGSVATIAIDNTVFKLPLLHGDSVTVVGTPVHVGQSSIVIHVQASRLQFPTRVMQRVAESFFVMVAIDQQLHASATVPALELTDAAHIALQEKYDANRRLGRQLSDEMARLQATPPSAAEVNNEVNSAKKVHVRFEETKTTADRLFFPGHLNINKTIFGGSIVSWMEKHAVQCGRMFTGNKHVSTVGMHNVQFKNPIFLTDWVKLEAHVTYVHNTTLEVDVVIHVERGNAPVFTNKASFVLVNLDELGQRRLIQAGLDLSDASPEWRVKYAMAKCRYEHSKLSYVSKSPE